MRRKSESKLGYYSVLNDRDFRFELANDYSSKNHVYCYTTHYTVCSITAAPLIDEFFIFLYYFLYIFLIVLRSWHEPSFVTHFLHPCFTFAAPL